MGCTYETAVNVLRECHGNIELAMNRILDAPVSSLETHVPPAGAPASATAAAAMPPSPPARIESPPSSAPPTYDAQLHTTDDQDADLQRAMEASMADQPRYAGAAAGTSDEDEQLMRALAASVSSNESNIQARPELDRLRHGSEPVVFVPSIPTYKAAAFALQALYAAEPVRSAWLSYPNPDSRTDSVAMYWAGASPVRHGQLDDHIKNRIPLAAQQDMDGRWCNAYGRHSHIQ